MSDLLKLNNIAKRNGDIRMFPLDNIKSAQTGKNGWGQITIAINNESVIDILTDKGVGALYLVGKEDWEKESEVE